MSSKLGKIIQGLEILIEDVEGDAYLEGKTEGYETGKRAGYDKGYKACLADHKGDAKKSFDAGFHQGQVYANGENFKRGYAAATKMSRAAFEKGLAEGRKDAEAVALKAKLVSQRSSHRAANTAHKAGRTKGHVEGYLEGYEEGYAQGYAARKAKELLAVVFGPKEDSDGE